MDSKALAKILVRETFGENGELSSARAAAACDYVETRIPATRRLCVLREYLRLLRPSAAREEALVELSGDVGAENFEAVKKFILAQTGKNSLRFEKKISPELIGGIRITSGDNIWERSAQSALREIGAGTPRVK